MKLTILRGLSGSGKSTLANQLATKATLNSKSFRICSADQYFERSEDGEYVFDAKQLPNAHAFCRELVKLAMADYVDEVILDNTNTQEWEYKPYLAFAKDYGYDIEIITVGELTPEAIAEYAQRNLHGLTEEMIAKQAKRFEVKK